MNPRSGNTDEPHVPETTGEFRWKLHRGIDSSLATSAWFSVIPLSFDCFLASSFAGRFFGVLP